MKAEGLFERSEPGVAKTYACLIAALKPFKPLTIEVKKTSVHIVGTKGAFAGVHARKSALLLNIRSAAAIKSPRIRKVEKVSAHRFHNELLLNAPADVDKELLGWLREAHALSA
jgi:hypothetical protein